MPPWREVEVDEVTKDATAAQQAVAMQRAMAAIQRWLAENAETPAEVVAFFGLDANGELTSIYAGDMLATATVLAVNLEQITTRTVAASGLTADKVADLVKGGGGGGRRGRKHNSGDGS